MSMSRFYLRKQRAERTCLHVHSATAAVTSETRKACFVWLFIKLGKKGNGKAMRIFKQSKNCKKRTTKYRIKRVSVSAVTVGLLAGIIMQHSTQETPVVYGAESEESAPKVVVTEIFHRHIGDAIAGGGCYGEEIPHVHQGTEQDGGACYETAVEHVHQGNAVDGGGCYSVPVKHVHQGDEQQGGACYVPVYHTHEDQCYQDKICTIRYTKGAVVDNWTEECDEHGPQAPHEKAEGIGSHQDCGIGEENLYLLYCKECGIMSYSYHNYNALICSVDTNQPVGYELCCGRENDEIEGYEMGCGMAEGSIEYYQLTCKKSLEGFNRNCGLDEKTPCGRLVVTNESGDSRERAEVSVRLEDLSGGKLVPADDPFCWYDESGQRIGSGEQIQVSQNGNYTVELTLLNRDVDESGLKSSITVDNILPKADDNAQEEKTPAPTPSKEAEGAEEEEDPYVPSATKTPVANTVSEEEAKEENPEKEEAGEADEPRKIPNRTESTASTKKASTEEDLDEGAAEPSVTPAILQKDTKQKKLPEIKAPNTAAGQTERSKLFKGIFAIPAVRIITLTIGTLLILAGAFLLLLYIRRSVRLYNDDGEGRLVYLGRLSVRLEEDGYAVTISEKMEEKAYTNRYCIRPGLFRIGKAQQELLVYKGAERCTVCLEREMIVVI